MGSTILAHAIYACSKSNFEPTDVFSSVGHAHKVHTYNNTNLTAWHKDSVCIYNIVQILEVISVDWYEILRIKFSYAKWWLDTPRENHFLKFGFTEPVDGGWLENLTIKYHTLIQLSKEATSQFPVLLLGDYLTNKLDSLRDAVETIGWTWDSDRSDAFYKEMMLYNSCYIDWLETIKKSTHACVNRTPMETKFDFWEQAIIIAKVCDIENIHPTSLHWKDYGCFLDTNNVSLIESLERIKNGKTI